MTTNFATPAGMISASPAPSLADAPKVARMWHGRTLLSRADEYRQYLFEAGVQRIAGIPGNLGVQMLVSKGEAEADFIVISYWKSIEDIKGYAGSNYMQVNDLPRDDDFLIGKEKLVRHFDLDVDFRQGSSTG